MSANKRSAKMPAKISDVLRNHVKEKLARGEVVASMTVRLFAASRSRASPRPRVSTAFMSTWSIRAFRSKPRARSAWPRSKPASRRSCACRARPTCSASSTPARSASSRRMSAPPPRRATMSRRQNIRRSASAPTPATCPTCNIARSRPPRPTRRSMPPPW